MNRIARLTRAQLEGLAFAGLLALLAAISSLFDVPAGVNRDLSAMASNHLTASGAGARHH